MVIWTYDETFEGLLTLVFDAYEMKTFPDKVLKKSDQQPSIFPGDYTVVTDEEKAKRVWVGLHKKISESSCQMLFHVFLSEMPDTELLILRYVKDVFESTGNIEFNFGNRNVLEVSKIARKVGHEKHRILMFARFQKTADDIYYASFDPAYDVLPLVTEHFENRFADQKWIIYDTRRNYGFYYDLKSTSEIVFNESVVNPATGKIDKSILDKDEQLFQELWQGYFKSMCIKERINPKLHVQLLPRRYWKYLIEKQTSASK
jgi:probable DNA metabolism protein